MDTDSETVQVTYIMTLDTCISTGTLLSLKAVVIKHPNVRAAITLREKAKSEFALDSTVFMIQSISDQTKTMLMQNKDILQRSERRVQSRK